MEQPIRGDITECSLRHAKANNVYIPNDYKPNEVHSFLMCLDMINLYGTVTVEALIYDNFHWGKFDQCKFKKNYLKNGRNEIFPRENLNLDMRKADCLKMYDIYTAFKRETQKNTDMFYRETPQICY